MNKSLKQLLSILVVLATIGVFAWYFHTHPAALQQLQAISPLTLGLLFVLYLCFVGSVALVLLATVALCNIRVSGRDGVLLTMWSSIINFFGPLQSGPAFRAVYLRKVHDISLKQYGLATLLYYGFYAVISGLFLLSALLPWYWLAALLVLGGLVGFGLLRADIPISRRLRSLPLKNAYKLAVATLVQLIIVAIIYAIELRSINAAISFHQAFVYAGAANFALFVSITPGAIGFREAFLVFTEKLHHIDPATILAANLIDRSVYIMLLVVLFLVAISVHAKARLTRGATS